MYVTVASGAPAPNPRGTSVASRFTRAPLLEATSTWRPITIPADAAAASATTANVVPGPPRTETPSGKRQPAAQHGDHRDLWSEERQQRAASRAQIGDCRKESAERQRRAGEHKDSPEHDEHAAPAL